MCMRKVRRGMRRTIAIIHWGSNDQNLNAIAPVFNNLSAPVGLQEVEDSFRYVVALENTQSQLVGDIDRHITRPALSGIEGDDANRLVVLAREQVVDQGIPISGVFVSLAPGSRAKCRAKIIQHEIGVLLWPMGRDGWPGTQNELHNANQISLRVFRRPERRSSS